LITRFPVPFRAVLGDRMQGTLYEVLENLVAARYDRGSRPRLLAQVNLDLEKARYHVRLARDLKLWDGKRQEHGAGRIDEVGRQVGGWLASCAGGTRS
jgi:hypothetical protein